MWRRRGEGGGEGGGGGGLAWSSVGRSGAHYPVTVTWTLEALP